MLKTYLNLSIFEKKTNRSSIIPWFILSLIPTLYFSFFAVQKAFSRDYIVQDDVRQHVFWMERFVDPELFPNDWIADYYQAIAPAGYKAFYFLIAKLGIEPLLLAKILPIFLGLIAAAYGFWVAFQLLPIPFGAFVSTVILSQSLWLEDDIVTSTPRAFLYPLFLAFLYYFMKRSLLPCVVAIALQSLFYPQIALIDVGILALRLVRWQQGKLTFSRERSDYLFLLTGGAVALVLLLVFSQDLSTFGPVVTAAQMKEMPEFQPSGRANYFTPNLLSFWFEGDSGISPSLNPPIIWVSVLLPILLKKHHPLTNLISKQSRVLVEILIPSFGLFFLAHLLVLRLYSPSRFTQHSLRLVMALAAGMVVTMLLYTCVNWLVRDRWSDLKRWQQIAIGFWGFFISASIIVPAIPFVLLSGHNQLPGRAPEVYEFFSQQPKDIRIASSSSEATNIPTFSKRSILASWEYALPYHLGYYNQIRQRAIDLMKAQYSPDLSELKRFIETYDVDFFLIERGDFVPGYIANNHWLIQYQPEADEAIDRLKQRPKPAMARLINRCSSLETKRLIVLEASCLAGAQLR